MFARLGQSQPAQGADVIARAMGALALIALAVIHVVDLPATLGPTPLVGIGYFGIIAAALGVGGAMIARSHWLVWAAAGAVAVMAMGGYVLTRALPGGFLGDHGDQVAYNGHLLYTFADDHAGQMTGQGVQGFFVATPGLTSIAGSSAPAGTAPAAPSGNGYGY